MKANNAQQSAITHSNGPLLIIAGAGTGKTTVITERIKHLILEENVAPHEILALTFTEKAAAEMTDRIDKIMPYGYSTLWISTFHSFCDTILREEAIHIGLNPNYKLMSESDSILFLKKNLFSFNLNYFRPLGNPNKFLTALLTHFSRLQDEDITPSEYLKYSKAISNFQFPVSNEKTPEQLQEEIEKTQELAAAFSLYTQMKLAEGMLDFSDLIAQTLSILRKRKQILSKYQQQFKYLLIDEFQDTNFAQNTLAILLAGDKKNITVVADDDQAIYRWRGAALSNVIQFRNNFPNTKIITLTQNYRSTQEILDRSYNMIQNNNPNRLEAIEQIDKKLISNSKKKGAPIELLLSTRIDEEAESIGKKIHELMQKEKYSYSDFAILVRANNHAQPIAASLQRQQIPYQFLGPAQLFLREEIKDLIAYLKAIYNLEDTVSLFRLLQMDIFGISMRDLTVLLQFARKNNISLFETMEKVSETSLTDAGKTKILEITTMLVRHLERIKKDTAGQILYYFLADTGLLNQFMEYKTAREEQIAVNIAKFFDRIKTFETRNTDASVYAVIEWIDLMMEMGDSPQVQEVDWKELDAVNILTVHSSKGLEFPVVFVVNLVTDRFPGRNRREQLPVPPNLIKEIVPEGDYHLQEERRLFYVAMTRAKERLYFTASKFYTEGKRERKLSPFVLEALPEELGKITQKRTPTQLSLIEVTRDYSPDSFAIKADEDTKPVQIATLSFSQLQSFDMCPLHFKARYLLNLPTPATAPLSFGTTMHATIKDLYLSHMNDMTIPKNELPKLLRKNWISTGYSSKKYEQEMIIHGEFLLDQYYHTNFNPETTPLAIETPFSFYVNKIHSKNETPVKILGVIDRIDRREDGGIEIIDYKTGNPDSLSKRSYQLQLGVYALAANRVRNEFLGKQPEEITVSLLYLETGVKLSQQIKPEDLESTEDALREKIYEIETSDFRCNKNMLCHNCEYKMLCNT